ncbi:hypothetical protein [Aeromicrobium sp.]|uniref:hypothetical protein n=1 Tax=Aeromicrobium sp. TaxID=1871063 RepID=UPI0030BC7547
MPSPHVPDDSILADILCLPVEGQPRRSNRGTLQPSVVKGAARYIDSSGIVEKIQEWRDEDDPDRALRGGRPSLFADRLVLILLMSLLFSGEAPLVTRMAEVLTSRLDTRSRDLLRLPRLQDGTDTAVYHRLYRALRRFIAVVDSAPGTTGKRLTRAEVDAIKANRNPDECAKKQARLIWLSNTLLEATFQMLPAETRERWQGNLCVDATLIRAWGKNGSPKADNDNRDISQDLMSPDIDAGWYYRDADHREPPHRPGRSQPKKAWGNEAHLAVMTANDPADTPNYPLLVLGISFDKPAGRVAENAMTTIGSIIERGHPAGFFVADRAYLFNSIPSKLQLPARALGYQLCGDYRDDQLGLQGSHNGANLVEGNWYSPSMPEPLIEATRQFRAKQIDETTYRQRISQRTQYLFRNKQAPSDNGANVMFCPARGPGATASCPLAGPGPGPVNLGIPTARTRILTPPAHPATCCTNQNSVTFPAEAGAKYRQELQYATPEWHALYSTLRNTIEGFNGYVKSPTDEDLEQAARRRMRGYTIQFILTTAMIAASNVRKIKSFVIRENRPARPTRVRVNRRRRGPSLRDYRPDPNAPPRVIPGTTAA